MRRAGRITALALAALGAGLLAWSATAWTRAGDGVDALRAKLAEREAALASTRSELHATSLRFQAFQQSIPTIPDSIRAASTTAIADQGKDYEKSIYKLQVSERDLQLDVTRLKRKLSGAVAAREARAKPVAVAGAGAWVCAALVAVASFRRKAA